MSKFAYCNTSALV